MITIPKLHFNGECERALNLYAKVFRGKITTLEYYRDADIKDLCCELTEREEGYVYHAEMTIGNQKFFLSDSLNKIPCGANLSIALTYDYEDELLEAYSLLIDKGTTITPLTNKTYTSNYVSLIDRFGIRWELMQIR